MSVNMLVVPTVVLAALFFLAGRRISARPQSRGVRMLWGTVAGILALPGLLFAAYYLHLFDNAVWFYEFRAIPYTELLAAGTGMLAGLLHPIRWKLFSMSPVALGLAAVLLMPYAKPVLLPVRMSAQHDQWAGGVCMQSLGTSCGPACIATLLRTFGFSASERRLVRECHTSHSGTENWYMARALRRRGLRVRYVVMPVKAPPPSPAIAGVIPGHFIVVLGKDGGQYTLADPLIGKLTVSEDRVHQATASPGSTWWSRNREETHG